MKRFKRIILPLFKTNRGKPRFLNRFLLLSTNEVFIHRWISKNLEKNDVVLDIGANMFPYTHYQNVKAIFGIDLPTESEGYLGWTDEKLGKILKQTNLFPIWSNCEEIPFEDNSFDKIIMTEVLEHIERDELAISEIARVLNKYGKLFITTPNGKEVEKTNPYHLRHYRVPDLKVLLEKYFQKIDIQLKFPNHDLFVKQHLPKNKYLPKRLFWRYIYEIWYLIYGNKHHNGGYIIAATCSYPKDKSSREPVTSHYLDIVVCPNCKGKLKERSDKHMKHQVLLCGHCGVSYPLRKGIPFLLTAIPHHQAGPPLI